MILCLLLLTIAYGCDSLERAFDLDPRIETMLELYRAIDQGTLEAAEPRSSETPTPTSIEDWARSELAPALG